MDEILSELGEARQAAVAEIVAFGPKLLLAIGLLIVGLWGIRVLDRMFSKVLQQKAVDSNLRPFLKSFISVALKIALVLSIAGMLGLQTTSFVAILGAAGLAIGFALQGSLGNFAGGVLILLFRPFRIGDAIEAQGFSGVVREIQIFNTVLTSFDNRRVVLPNGPLAGGAIVNINAEATRRVDLKFGVSYSDDLSKVRSILTSLVEQESRAKKDPAPLIVISELADSAVVFLLRFWVDTPDYWAAFFDMTEKVKRAFDEEGVSIPFPQRDVHFR